MFTLLLPILQANYTQMDNGARILDVVPVARAQLKPSYAIIHYGMTILHGVHQTYVNGPRVPNAVDAHKC